MGRGQEAVLLVRELRVERRAGHPGSPDDVSDGDGGVAGLGYGGYHRPQQPFPMRCPDGPLPVMPGCGSAPLLFSSIRTDPGASAVPPNMFSGG
jgi:hypothetical protein